MSDIRNKYLDQLRRYAEWERQHYPDDKDRLHVLDWAVEEIVRLRSQINELNGMPF